MAKVKNPFKKGNVMDTVVSVGIGGASNVAIDYAVTEYNKTATTKIEADTVNLVKFIGGSIGSAMVGNKYLKAALDGIGVVGASNYLASIMESTTTGTGDGTGDGTGTGTGTGTGDSKTSGIPYGVVGRVGRIRTKNANYARRAKMSGTSDMVG